jgi:dTDP-D-glucose 4,6-dehydratase
VDHPPDLPYEPGLDGSIPGRGTLLLLNLAGPVALTVLELVRLLATAIGLDTTLPGWAVPSADRPGQDRMYAIDGSRMSAIHGWKARRRIDAPAEIEALIREHGSREIEAPPLRITESWTAPPGVES